MPVPARLAVALGLLAVASPARYEPGGRAVAPPVERIVANANRVPAGRVRHGILTLHLELRTGTFRPHADDGPGVEVQAFGEAGRPLQIPGPLIRVPEGTVIEATIRNRLRDSTLVLHGFGTRTAPADGHLDANEALRVPPGATRRLRFDGRPCGHLLLLGQHDRQSRWTTTGGSTASSPAASSSTPRARRPPPDERIFVMGLWLKPADTAADDPGGEFMVINGKSWPETERLRYYRRRQGALALAQPHLELAPDAPARVLLRSRQPRKLGGDTVYAPAERRLVVTELMPPGGTMAARWTPARPGNWLFHCHFAFHISDDQSLSAPPDRTDGTAGQMQHHMAGLVLGIHVRSARSSPVSLAVAAEPVEPGASGSWCSRPGRPPTRPISWDTRCREGASSRRPTRRRSPDRRWCSSAAGRRGSRW